MRLALPPLVPLRKRLAKTAVATLIVFSSLVAVGMTAPAEAPFTITLRPMFATLGLNVDIKVWTVHVHFTWSALPTASASTKVDVTPLQPLMDPLIQDVRYAIRLCARTPGFTAVAVLALALGIGANTAIFTIVDAVLLERLPFRDPQRIVALWE